MDLMILIFVALTLLNAFVVIDGETEEVNCKDLKNLVLGSVFYYTRSKKKETVEVKVLLATNTERNPVELKTVDWSAINTSAFNPFEKTILVIHGYKSSGTKKWVIELKDRLLDTRNVNIILIDWSQASNRWNYVNAAKNTKVVSDYIYNFLNQMRWEINNMNHTSDSVKWNHLYFIGHSLGAHVSGQIAHLLKKDEFWKVERITALDPAQPCFGHIDLNLKVDKRDADFVDVIHTQADTDNTALGLGEDLGHMDFYVNGGIIQPECEGSIFTLKVTKMICSHKFSYKYFIDSIKNSANDGCDFISYPWDGTFKDATEILSLRATEATDNVCTVSGCPEMGINADKSNQTGKFFVITALDEPYCNIRVDNKYIKKILKVIKRLKNK